MSHDRFFTDLGVLPLPTAPVLARALYDLYSAVGSDTPLSSTEINACLRVLDAYVAVGPR